MFILNSCNCSYGCCRVGRPDHAKSEYLPGGCTGQPQLCNWVASANHTRCKATPVPTGANRAPKGTGQGSVAAGSDPACTLLHYATNSDFAPKPNRPTRPTTIPSAPPMLRLQPRSRNDCFAKCLQTFRNCNASKGNCNEQAHSNDAVSSDAIPVEMQSKAMQSKQCNPSNAICIC